MTSKNTIPYDYSGLSNQELSILSIHLKLTMEKRHSKIIEVFSSDESSQADWEQVLGWLNDSSLTEPQLKCLFNKNFTIKDIDFIDRITRTCALTREDKNELWNNFFYASVKDPIFFNALQEKYPVYLRQWAIENLYPKTYFSTVHPDVFDSLVKICHIKFKPNNFKSYIKDDYFSIFKHLMESPLYYYITKKDGYSLSLLEECIEGENLKSSQYLVENFKLKLNTDTFDNPKIKRFCNAVKLDFFSYFLKNCELKGDFVRDFTYHFSRERRVLKIWQIGIDALFENPSFNDHFKEELAIGIASCSITQFKEHVQPYFLKKKMESQLTGRSSNPSIKI